MVIRFLLPLIQNRMTLKFAEHSLPRSSLYFLLIQGLRELSQASKVLDESCRLLSRTLKTCRFSFPRGPF